VREAGAVILGKTTMPDYGMLSSGLSSLHGVTRNPWRLDRNPSGSSSGAAAAAVAGYGPLHIGTDIGGSVRLPATHCGLFALKPSLGRVPIHPPYMGRVAGPMTRTVEDAALLLDVIARPDVRDFMSLPPPGKNFCGGLDALDPKGISIGFIAGMGAGLAVHPEVRAAAHAAAAALEAAGCRVEPVRSFLTEEMLDGVCRFFEARSHNDFMQLSEARRSRVLPFVAEWCTWRAAGFSGRDVMQAYSQVMAMREAAVAATARHDFLLSPTLADPRLRGRASRAGRRSAQRPSPHRVHGPLQHVRAAGRLDQLVVRRGRPADRRAGDRPAFRRPRGLEALPLDRNAAAAAARLARAPIN
jgi:aspartyl-tRNA(Asn)/glutamyl-tRNA(Gln) amidotransferase subunit A